MKAITLTLLAISLTSCMTTKFVAKTPNEIPMFGTEPLTADEVAANDKFVKAITNLGKPLRDQSNHLVDEGMRYLNRRDYSTSVKRVNQGWLLDKDNPRVYWGFGDWYGRQGEYQQAVAMFNRGLEIDARNTDLLVDLALTYNYQGIDMKNGGDPEGAKDKFTSAIELLTTCVSIRPDWPDPYLTWSASLTQLGQYDEAYDKAVMSDKLGGRVDPGWIHYLANQAMRKKNGLTFGF